MTDNTETREAIARIVRTRLDQYNMADFMEGPMHLPEGITDAILARFNVTPKTDTDEAEWEYGWFCEWDDGSGISRLLHDGAEKWGPNGRVFQMRREKPGPWVPVPPTPETGD